MNRYDELDQHSRETRVLYSSLVRMGDAKRNRDAWRRELRQAWKDGAKQGNGYVRDHPSAKDVHALDALSRKGYLLTDHEIEVAVDALCEDLRHHDVRQRGPRGDYELRSTFGLLLRIIKQAESDAAKCDTEVKRLQRQITSARAAGNARRRNKYTWDRPSAMGVRALADLRRAAKPIETVQLRKAVGELAPDLRANNVDIGDSDLEEVRQLLWDLIDYAEQYATARYRSLKIAQQFEYGSFPLAPTRMGNVARTVQNYTVHRYNFNFEFLWSRLQVFAQKDKDFGPTLQAAKTQLDFLISCSAWTFVWSLFWAAWLCLSQGPALAFLGVALAGPLMSYGWYRAAVAQYRTVTDLLRSSVDLFRFDLLGALRYPQPSSVKDETQLWQTIDELHVRHELSDLRYTPPRPT